MFHAIVIFLLYCTFLQPISNQGLNGIFLIDSCDCNGKTDTCEPSGPFKLSQIGGTLTINYGSSQAGVGTLGSNLLDLYLNKNRCKGFWDAKNHSTLLKCQHKGGVICKTKFRCLSGSCLDETAVRISSAPKEITFTFLFMIGILIMLV